MSRPAKNANDADLDAELIEQTKQGRTEAYGELVAKYQNRLYHALVAAFGDETEAEDVCQEAFVQAYTKLDSFRGDSAFYTWLYRIAFNTFVSSKRRKRPRISVDQHREAFGSEPVDCAESASERVDRQERASIVHQALDQVSDEHRRILILREMEEMDYESIAEVLDLPVGTVRSRLHRARSQLRVEIERLDKQPSNQNIDSRSQE
jgi:RNA polymerase sigma-70 factor (ECF subfamily)